MLSDVLLCLMSLYDVMINYNLHLWEYLPIIVSLWWLTPCVFVFRLNATRVSGDQGESHAREGEA